MIRAGFTCLALLALSGPAMAQQAPGATSSYPIAEAPPAFDRSHAPRRLAGGFADRMMNRSVRSPERVARARRLAVLANSGDCLAAYNIALEEHDEEIAANLARECDLPARDVRTVRRTALP